MKYPKPAGNQPTEFNFFANRRNLPKLIILGVIFLGFVLSGCDFGNVDAAAQTPSKEDSNMETIRSATTVQQAIPPIDAAVIPEIQTATFAMG